MDLHMSPVVAYESLLFDSIMTIKIRDNFPAFHLCVYKLFLKWAQALWYNLVKGGIYGHICRGIFYSSSLNSNLVDPWPS